MVCESTALDMSRISIAKDYSEFPVGRFPADSEFNGEKFREDYLVPALKEESTVTVNIDGAEGYGSSFLEEAFGGLVRKGHYSSVELHKRLIVECKDVDYNVYKGLIWKYIDDAKPE